MMWGILCSLQKLHNLMRPAHTPSPISPQGLQLEYNPGYVTIKYHYCNPVPHTSPREVTERGAGWRDIVQFIPLPVILVQGDREAGLVSLLVVAGEKNRKNG